MEKLKFDILTYINGNNEELGTYTEEEVNKFIGDKADKLNYGLIRSWKSEDDYSTFYDCGPITYQVVPHPEFGTTEPTEYEEKYCKGTEPFEYKGYSIPIYFDDYGQQMYCYIENKCYTFGAYNLDYEEDIKYIIDKLIKNTEDDK